jgi:hypothetical protein
MHNFESAKNAIKMSKDRSIFGLQPKILEALPKYQEDLFVVAVG